MSSLPATVPLAPRDQAWRLRSLVGVLAGETEPQPIRRPARTVPVVAIASGKGGVGKTNLSVNLAIALQSRGVRTTLLDADLGMANADVLCGLTPRRRLDEVLFDPAATIDACATIAPGGFTLVPGAVGVARVADLSPERRNRLVDQFATLESASDLLLVDTGAGIGSDVLAFAGAADWLVVVVTPDPTSIADAYGLIKCVTTRSPAPRRIGIVVNQVRARRDTQVVSGRICACCHRFLGHDPVVLGGIAHDERVVRSIRARSPHMLAAPRTRASRQIAAIATELTGALALKSS